MRHLMVGLLLAVTAQAHADDRLWVAAHTPHYDANSLGAKKQYAAMRHAQLERVCHARDESGYVKVAEVWGE